MDCSRATPPRRPGPAQAAAEALFYVGSHILRGEFHESVDEYRDIPGRLRARAVLSEATARRLDGLAGFRNVRVHEYADVDLRRVHAGLDRLGDFAAFLADVDGGDCRPGRRRHDVMQACRHHRIGEGLVLRFTAEENPQAG